MRPRKRADWSVVVYQYWVRLEHETWESMPEPMRQEAEAMRTLWNTLVDDFAQRRATAAVQTPHDALTTASRTVRQQTLSSSGRTRKHSFDDLRRLAANSTATWANRQFVLTQFQAALARFYKKQNRPPRRKLGPMAEVHFHHRFTSGGLPVERIFGRGQRVHLEPVSPEAFDPRVPQRQRKRLSRTTGAFLVGDSSLSLQLILHRPLPTKAYLKAATLIGRREGGAIGPRFHPNGHSPAEPWRWSLHLTLETPPSGKVSREKAGPIAVLNVASQFIDENHLRIALLTDVSGREEAIFLPSGILRSWRYKRALQSKTNQFLTETKTRLRETPDREQFSPAARRLLARLDAVRAPGLWRLLALLESEAQKSEACTLLQRWAGRSARLQRETRGLERRYLHHRDWFYRNTALQLCRRYQRLVLTTTSLGESDTSHQLAAPSRFITFLLQTAKKTNAEVQVQKDEQHPSEQTRQGFG